MKKKLKSRFENIFSNCNLSTGGFQEAQPSGIDMFSLTPTMKCVERIYYDEKRSTSQLSGNSPIEFIIAVQNALEYIDLKGYVIILFRLHSYCLQFSIILYGDRFFG